jgi:hypothetical protein
VLSSDGDRGAGGDIPGGATLNFEVECLGINDTPAAGGPGGEKMPNIFNQIDTNNDDKLTAEEVQAWFKSQRNMDAPEGLFDNEDKDDDNVISWEEFSGPKGTSPHDEL